ncbi:MAG: DUF4124 domain-containing protein [Acinetobacter sp.]|nr:DUF4124 domain-containing protein [Acinetobacter sp.]MDN5513139.1 DUF4124 domain-containing protein [Acinetobacter sp.]MDN5525781.1 DUF4124 domain-containing protein [Acinetobacter sp.]
MNIFSFLFNYLVLSLILLASACIHAQDFYKWVDANGSTHYTSTPPPKNAKRLGSISTYQNKTEQSKKVPRSKEQIQNHYSFPTTAKIELTAAERAAIEIQVKQPLQKNQQTLKQDPYANMFGSATEQDICSSIESAYLQKKEKLVNSKASPH